MGARAVGMHPNSLSDLQRNGRRESGTVALTPRWTLFAFIFPSITSFNTLLHLIASPTGGKNK